MNKIFLVCFLLFSSVILSQKNNILVSPSSMNGWSSIIITTQEKGNYNLVIKDKTNNKILFLKNLDINKRNSFKHDFSLYPKGKYVFIVENNNKEVFNTTKIKR